MNKFILTAMLCFAGFGSVYASEPATKVAKDSLANQGRAIKVIKKVEGAVNNVSGDANEDGRVTISDFVAAEEKTPNKYTNFNADNVNFDGDVVTKKKVPYPYQTGSDGPLLIKKIFEQVY